MTLFAAIRGGATSPSSSTPAISTRIESKPATIHETNQPIPHCVPSGSFSVLAVGESFYHDEIAIIAGNSSGRKALVYCTATLLLDDDNPHDSQAVAVLIDGRKVGHLCREDAARYRNGLDRAGHGYARTTCNAILLGGLVTPDRQYAYSVELDFSRDSPLDMDRNIVPMYPRPVHADSGISIVHRSPEEIVIRLPYISHDLTGLCQECAPIDTWTDPDGDNLHFLCQGTVGGSGRLGVLSKTDSTGIFSEIQLMDHISVFRLYDQTLYVRAAKAPDARMEFHSREAVSLVVIDVELKDGKAVSVVAMPFTAKTSNGAMLKQGERVSWNTNTEQTSPEASLDRLIDLFNGADMVVSRTAKRELTALHALLGKSVVERPLSRSATQMWGESLPESVPGTLSVEISGASDSGDVSSRAYSCHELARFLFQHTGKTARSQTMLSLLMR